MTWSAGKRFRSSTALEIAASISSIVRAPEPPTLLTTMSSPPKVGPRAVDDRRRTLGRRDVRDDAVGPPGPAARGDRLVQRLRPARAEHDVRALLDEPRRDAAADPPARAGDERRPSRRALDPRRLAYCVPRPASCSPATARRTGTASDAGRATPTRRSTSAGRRQAAELAEQLAGDGDRGDLLERPRSGRSETARVVGDAARPPRRARTQRSARSTSARGRG